MFNAWIDDMYAYSSLQTEVPEALVKVKVSQKGDKTQAYRLALSMQKKDVSKGIDAVDEQKVVQTNFILQGSQSKEILLVATLPALQLWSAEKPTLYRVTVFLENVTGDILDKKEKITGFRTVDFSEELPLINGSPIWLNGVRDVQGISSKEDCREELILLKRQNVNAIKIRRYLAKSNFFEVCDYLGLYVIMDFPLDMEIIEVSEGETPDIQAREGSEEEVAETKHNASLSWLALEARNHPSLIAWQARPKLSRSLFLTMKKVIGDYDWLRPIIFYTGKQDKLAGHFLPLLLDKMQLTEKKRQALQAMKAYKKVKTPFTLSVYQVKNDYQNARIALVLPDDELAFENQSEEKMLSQRIKPLEEELRIEITNLYSFTDLNEFEWFVILLEDGVPIREQAYPIASVEPVTATQLVTQFKTSEWLPQADYILRVEARLKEATGYAVEGYCQIFEQFVLQQGESTIFEEMDRQIQVLDRQTKVFIKGQDFQAEINRRTGDLVSYQYKQVERLAMPLSLYFDVGGDYSLVNLMIEEREDGVAISLERKAEWMAGVIESQYHFYASGNFECHLSGVPKEEGQRFGLRFGLDKSLSQVSWYGKMMDAHPTDTGYYGIFEKNILLPINQSQSMTHSSCNYQSQTRWLAFAEGVTISPAVTLESLATNRFEFKAEPIEKLEGSGAVIDVILRQDDLPELARGLGFLWVN